MSDVAIKQSVMAELGATLLACLDLEPLGVLVIS